MVDPPKEECRSEARGNLLLLAALLHPYTTVIISVYLDRHRIVAGKKCCRNGVIKQRVSIRWSDRVLVVAPNDVIVLQVIAVVFWNLIAKASWYASI